MKTVLILSLLNVIVLGQPNKILQDEEKKTYQQEINQAVNQMFVQKDTAPVDKKILSVASDAKMPESYKVYWTAYLNYKRSIFFKSILKQDGNAEKAIDKALDTLLDKAKTSEDYALLAACTSFSIQFANFTQMGRISAKVKEYAGKSLDINPKNLRAYYVLTSNNFYTPKMFGGGTRVEEYSAKALACPSRLNTDFYAPSWGKAEVYRILIQYYKAEKKLEKVKSYEELLKKS